MAKLVPVGDVDIDVDVDVDVVVDDYGSTHDEELVVPLTLMVDHPNSHPSWKTKGPLLVQFLLCRCRCVLVSVQTKRFR